LEADLKKATVVIYVLDDFERLNKLLAKLVGDFEIIIVDDSAKPLYQSPPYGSTYIHGFRFVLNGFAKRLHVCPQMVTTLGYEYATTGKVIFMYSFTELKDGWFDRYQATGKF
jgi:hypothetical protein